MRITLKRWEKGLGESDYLALSNGNFIPASGISGFSGWYADYDEGRFAYWQDGITEYISWRGRKLELTQFSQVEWWSEMTGRNFRVLFNGKEQLRLRYHTLIRRPWRVITDVLFLDDDWGLAYDLPSFIHSGHSDGNLAKLLAQSNERGAL